MIDYKEITLDFAQALSVNRQLDLLSSELYNLITSQENGKVVIKEGPKYYEIIVDDTRTYKIDKSTGDVKSAVGKSYYGSVFDIQKKTKEQSAQLTNRIASKGDREYFRYIKPRVSFKSRKSASFSAKGKIFRSSWGYNATINDYVKVLRDTPKMAEVVKLESVVTGDNDPSGGKSTPGKPIGKTFKLQKRMGRDGSMQLRGSLPSGRGPYTWFEWEGKPNYYNTWD